MLFRSQFYLDAPKERGMVITAHAEFLYGEDRVTPFAPAPAGLMRDARAETRARRLLSTWLDPDAGAKDQYLAADEEQIYRLLEEGIPALLAALAVLIAVSRVLCGVHYISDVLAGLAFGAIFALLGSELFVVFVSMLGFYPVMLL